MSSEGIPKYHIAPNFSIPPVEAGGLLQLGSIIANVSSADKPPVNEDSHVHILQTELFCSHQGDFTATKSRMESGDCGVWAKFIGRAGLGGELSWGTERSAEDVYRFRSMDTIYFKPSEAYIKESMRRSEVQDYLDGSGTSYVYMVTGLKTARGPSVRMHKSFKSKVSVELGLHEPGGLTMKVGPKFNTSKNMRWENSFQDSTDFIIGIRVNKLMYKKHWLSRARKTLYDEEYNKGATMVDDDTHEKCVDEVIDLGDDAEDQFEIEKYVIDDEINETMWVTG